MCSYFTHKKTSEVIIKHSFFLYPNGSKVFDGNHNLTTMTTTTTKQAWACRCSPVRERERASGCPSLSSHLRYCRGEELCPSSLSFKNDTDLSLGVCVCVRASMMIIRWWWCEWVTDDSNTAIDSCFLSKHAHTHKCHHKSYYTPAFMSSLVVCRKQQQQLCACLTDRCFAVCWSWWWWMGCDVHGM